MGRDETKITLRQLEIFLAAVEHRSFAKAARQLGLTASAVSMQMQNLGSELGVPLFEKDGRSIRPTAIATAVLPYAERMTATLNEAVEVVRGLQGEMDNRVRVAMVSTARNFGPHLVQAFQQTHPDTEVHVSIHNRRGVIAALENRQIDIALMGRTPRRVEVEAHRFAAHPYVLVASPKHPLTRFRKIHRSDLVAHKFLVREPGSGTRMVHEHFFQSAELPLPPAQEMDSNANIKQAVMANMGLAFISAHTIALELAAGKLCLLDVKGMPELRDWYVLHPKGAVLGRAAQMFRDFVSQEGPGFMQEFFEALPLPT
ncbi:LysR family transcriptional regulator [Leisingera daeponensis]|uniref:HTH-type transcriptional regulator CbbR n=1 Tax=Leisingera daeponensis TaxID=405746 RepID=A0ABS7NIP8_9RHOB|nr:LysR family transcriptional regulator [Leisingera daeponensis]MBY6141078.1 LysR family transcriptional regulator [Leisingera daeponensis]